MEKILIVYASKTGTTKDVAAALAEKATRTAELYDCRAKTLFESGGRPVKKQPNLADYSAVVIGTAMYMGAPMRAVKRFVKVHSKELAQISLAFYTCGVGTEEEDGVYLQKHLPQKLGTQWLYRHMGGEVRPEKISGFARMAMKEYEKQHGCKPAIDWKSVDALSRELATRLGEISV